jgi:hypothetical protein
MKLPGEGTCFDSILIILKWREDEKYHPIDLLASRSNPAAQEHERITHKNVKMFIIFWIFFTLAVCQSFIKQKTEMSANER